MSHLPQLPVLPHNRVPARPNPLLTPTKRLTLTTRKTSKQHLAFIITLRGDLAGDCLYKAARCCPGLRGDCIVVAIWNYFTGKKGLGGLHIEHNLCILYHFKQCELHTSSDLPKPTASPLIVSFSAVLRKAGSCSWTTYLSPAYKNSKMVVGKRNNLQDDCQVLGRVLIRGGGLI